MTRGPSHRELCIDVEFFCMISLSPKTLQRKTFPNIMATERTFIMIKPDGVQRGLVGEIISRFEKKGFKLVAMKVMQASVEHLEKHYADLSSKGFFRGLVTYMASGPVCAMVWEGLNAVKTGRVMLGELNQALPCSLLSTRIDYRLNLHSSCFPFQVRPTQLPPCLAPSGATTPSM